MAQYCLDYSVLPLLDFLGIYLFRFKPSSKVAGSIASAMVLIPFLISLGLFFSVDGKVTVQSVRLD